jgi:hypothetical protein
MSGKSTRKAKAQETDTLRSEYRREDLGAGVRGKYHKRYEQGTNLVLLSPDVAKAFPAPEDVNDALRSLAKIASRARV